jgi:hypothetical protein
MSTDATYKLIRYQNGEPEEILFVTGLVLESLREGNGPIKNRPPVINAAPVSLTLIQNRAFSFTIPPSSFSDPEGGKLILSFSNLPTGLSASENTISGKIAALGTHTILVRATDPEGLWVEAELKLTIEAADPETPKLAGHPRTLEGHWQGREIYSGKDLPYLLDIVGKNPDAFVDRGVNLPYTPLAGRKRPTGNTSGSDGIASVMGSNRPAGYRKRYFGDKREYYEQSSLPDETAPTPVKPPVFGFGQHMEAIPNTNS